MLTLPSTNIFLLALVGVIGFFTLKVYEIKMDRRLIFAKTRQRANESLKHLLNQFRGKVPSNRSSLQGKMRAISGAVLDRLADWIKRLARSIRD